MYPQTVKSLSFLTVALLLLTATLPVRADSNKHSMGAMHPSSAGSVQKVLELEVLVVGFMVIIIMNIMVKIVAAEVGGLVSV